MSPYEKLMALETMNRLIGAGYHLTLDFDRGFEAGTADVRNVTTKEGMARIMQEMDAVDECWLMANRQPVAFLADGRTKVANGQGGAYDGFVYFIWGNGDDGLSCMSNYSGSLRLMLDPVCGEWTERRMNALLWESYV